MNSNTLPTAARRRTIAYFKRQSLWDEGDRDAVVGVDGGEEDIPIGDLHLQHQRPLPQHPQQQQQPTDFSTVANSNSRKLAATPGKQGGGAGEAGEAKEEEEGRGTPVKENGTEAKEQQQQQQHGEDGEPPTVPAAPVHSLSTSRLKLKNLAKSRMMASRRRSEDVLLGPRQFLIDVESTRETILRQEDTDGDKKITIMDNGPKVVTLGTLRSEGFIRADVRGTYVISTLLQELTLAHEMGLKRIVLSETVLNENPVDRLTRMIKTLFWKNLTRTVDLQGLTTISSDPKAYCKVPRIYVPHDDQVALHYFQEIAEKCVGFNFEVELLPEVITPEYVRSINNKAGILSLQLRKLPSPKTVACPPSSSRPAGQAGCLIEEWEGVPFIVPGGRFNELYGWDSYFISLGLLVDDEVELARGLVDNLVYEITHYGMILNANRSYYLTRSQPPFLADMIIQVYRALLATDEEQREENRAWLAKSLRAVIKEYRTVWMAPPRLVEATGLSRYYDCGIGMPPETEPSHFDAVLTSYAHKHGMTLDSFRLAYIQQRVRDESLDEYFTHDRAVRESGHDTTYRLDGKAAHLNVVELNSMLYKYEVDIGSLIRDEFHDDFGGETSAPWFEAARRRTELITRYCWNEEKGMFFDYDFVKQTQSDYASVTTLFPLWAGCATEAQTQRIITEILPKFEYRGGLVSGLESSRGEISLDRPSRQWDYPLGWAPHQMIAWEALKKCGKPSIAQRLAYKWLFMIVKGYVDYNGTVPEKYDVVKGTHLIKVEYGNVGVDFAFISKEGFGWMNASFQVGLRYLTDYQLRTLKAQVVPDQVIFCPS